MLRMEEKTKKYYEAWWNCEVLDKVLITVEAPLDGSKKEKVEGTVGDRFNIEKILPLEEKKIQDKFYGGVALPHFRPGFGTDIFSGCMGAKIDFSPYDSRPVSWADWSKPVLKDYSDLSGLEVKDDNFYWKKIKEFTSYASEKLKNKYFVRIIDIHGGMDSLAVLRGSPEKVCMDLYDNPDGVKEAMKLIWKAWHKVHDELYEIISRNQEGSAAMGVWAPGKMYGVQNDFTCIISNEMYKEFFLEEVLNEINYLDYSIYHLDGVDALKHLDMILEIPKLNAIQWVRGASFEKEGVAKWIPLYKKIQLKKKAIEVYCKPIEIDFVLDNLSPEGLLISITCSSEKEAKELLMHKGWL